MKENHIKISLGLTVSQQPSASERRIIEYICAICGAGKTYSYTQFIKNSSGLFIVACKSSALCEQVYEEMTKQGVESVALVMGRNGIERKKREQQRVTSELYQTITQYKSRVVIATHAGLELLCNLLHDDMSLRGVMNDYTVILDEQPSARKPISGLVQLDKLDEYRWLSHTIKTGQQLVAGQNREALRRSLTDSSSRKIIIALLNGDRVRFEDDGQVMRLSGYARSDLYVLSECAKSFILCASRANKLPFAIQGQEYGLELIKNASIIMDESRMSYRNQSRVDLGSFCRGSVSKNRSRKQLSELAEHIAEYMKTLGKPFLFACNLDDDDPTHGAEWSTTFCKYLEPVGGKQIPYSSQGLNDYSDYTVTLWLGIGKLPPHMRSLLSEAVANAEDEANTSEAGFQFSARGAIRKIEDDQTRITMLFLDDEVRDYVKREYLPGANILTLPEFGLKVTDIAKAQADRGKRKSSKTLQAIQSAYDLIKLSGDKPTQKAVAERCQISQKTVSRNWSAISL